MYAVQAMGAPTRLVRIWVTVRSRSKPSTR